MEAAQKINPGSEGADEHAKAAPAPPASGHSEDRSDLAKRWAIASERHEPKGRIPKVPRGDRGSGFPVDPGWVLQEESARSAERTDGFRLHWLVISASGEDLHGPQLCFGLSMAGVRTRTKPFPFQGAIS